MDDRSAVVRARGYSRFTDPGEHADLLSSAPTQVAELSSLLKAQLIHPVDAHLLGRARLQAEGRAARQLLTVHDLLAALQQRAPVGLVAARRWDQRLVVPCDHHALLAAAALKAHGIPARVRAGWAHYLAPGRLLPHVVPEVHLDSRWHLFDPDRRLASLPEGGFVGAGEAWLAVRAGDLDPARLRDWRFRGLAAARLKLFVDANGVMGHEMVHYEWLRPGGALPRLLATAPSKLGRDDLSVLDGAASALAAGSLDDDGYEALVGAQAKPATGRGT